MLQLKFQQYIYIQQPSDMFSLTLLYNRVAQFLGVRILIYIYKNIYIFLIYVCIHV